MARTLIRCLAVTVWASVVVILSVTGASAEKIPTNSCGPLTSSGNTYVLTTDVSSEGICFTVAANNITLDLNGHSITAPVGVYDGGVARLNTVVKNSAANNGVPEGDGQIVAFINGINLLASSHNQVLGIEVSADGFVGIGVGDHSLVKNCRVEGQAEFGIETDHDGQVQGCVVVLEPRLSFQAGIAGGDNTLITQNNVQSGRWGIVVGDFSTVTYNQANSNQVVGIITGTHSSVNYNTANNNVAGIETGGFSSVAHNTANNNVAGGIAVGVFEDIDTTNSTVAFNTTNNNGGIGLEVVCPSTVANNVSQGNGQNYHFDGSGCILSNNK